ncbi:MAG TPA: MFS transporter, partial [Acetobacteraceae bacterium]|nr:MFS transporter [Acetobacteraceae bacterium]
MPLDSAVNVDFPRITAHFGLAIPLIQWVVVSYTLASASLVLVFGRAGDIAGHRRIFLLGTAWSGAAFLLCAMAPSFPWLLAGRALQGVGAGLVLSCGPALVTGLYPAALRPRAVGVYTATFGIGGALGPVLGGILLAQFDWSSVFWVRAPVALLALALGLRLPADGRALAAAPG